MPAPTQQKRLFPWIVLAVVVLGGGAFLAQGFFGRRGGMEGVLSDEYSAEGGDWQRYVVEALSIEAPFPFGSGPDLSARLPEEIRELIVSWKTREGLDPSTGLRAQVSHITYRDTVTVDLDGAVGGAMTEAAAALGDEAPDYTVTKAEISGLPARRAAYHRNRPAIYIDALFLQRGPNLWQVQAISNSKSARPLGERILNSVQLATVDEAPSNTPPPESPTPATPTPAR
jgi:hypothetical protein